jgi:hypothetical protein
LGRGSPSWQLVLYAEDCPLFMGLCVTRTATEDKDSGKELCGCFMIAVRFWGLQGGKAKLIASICSYVQYFCYHIITRNYHE